MKNNIVQNNISLCYIYIYIYIYIIALRNIKIRGAQKIISKPSIIV